MIRTRSVRDTDLKYVSVFRMRVIRTPYGMKNETENLTEPRDNTTNGGCEFSYDESFISSTKI
jgi:hypothetical protein